MASKNLLPVVALCGALATGTPIAAWATPVMADSLPGSPKPRTGPVERHCMQAVFAHTGNSLDLGMPSPGHGQLDSRGYQAFGQDERLPGRMRHLHVALSCARCR